MHKGEFYALLPKDAKDIQCTVEVFKTQSARRRSKPRTVSFEGREDDEAKSTVTNISIKAARYVVPARRHIITPASMDRKFDQDTVNISVLNSSAEVQIVPKDEVKPTFRTPCKYFYVGTIKLHV
jgi:hypothetical protein